MEQIVLNRKNGIGVLQILRPEALNALSRSIVDEMDRLIDTVSEDKAIRTLVIYSEKNFAAGADIKGMDQLRRKRSAGLYVRAYLQQNCSIAHPNDRGNVRLCAWRRIGACFGVRYPHSCGKCKTWISGDKSWNHAGRGGTIRAPRLIGEAKAKELIFSGAIIDAQTALAIGLVNQVVSGEALWESAEKLALKISQKSLVALAAAKRTIEAGMQMPTIEAGIAMEGDQWAALFESEDQKEGMRAFIEKRKPVFLDR